MSQRQSPAEKGAAALLQPQPKFMEAETIVIPPLPDVLQFRSWLATVRDNVSNASGRANTAFPWIRYTEMAPGATALEDLGNSGDFESLDAKLNAALMKAITNRISYNVDLVREELAKQEKS